MTGRAALICYHESPLGAMGAEWTIWPSVELARQAEVELTPCGDDCIDVHSVVRLDRPASPAARRGCLARFVP